LVWQSFQFNDISQGTDATPLWIPQLGMAVGCAIFAIALTEELVAVIRGEKRHPREPGSEPVRSE
jgi:TRAP-type C4-dicarboxylate transport system permease small subunit